MRLSFVLLAALALATPASLAQSRTTTAFDLVRLEPSARAAALAGTGQALPGDDPTAAIYNPALLGDAHDRQIAVGYLNHLSDVNAGTATYARRVAGVGLVAGTVRFLSYGDFERSTVEGGPTGETFGASEAAVSVSTAREVTPGVQVGATIHGLFASLDDASSQALAADLGVAYQIPEEGLVLSASVHHVGAMLSSLGGTRDRLPLDVRVGVSNRLQYLPLTISVMAYDLQSFDSEPSTLGPEGEEVGGTTTLDQIRDHLALGGELALGPSLTARLGYHPRRGAALRTGGRLELAGISAGFGISLKRVGVDYAYTGWSAFGGLHQFGVRTRL
ncbi:MAG: type IX secretion system protein PorQ [Bacteroidota bacterium]